MIMYDPDGMREEFGDVILQVNVLHSEIQREIRLLHVYDVIQSSNEKLYFPLFRMYW